MANVTLVNRTKRPARMLVLNLTKEHAPVPIEVRMTEETKDGIRSKRVEQRLIGDSLRIMAGERVEVDEGVLSCPDVVSAVSNRELLVEKRSEPAPQATPGNPAGEGEGAAPVQPQPATRRKSGRR